jgi:hypothetical protein
MNNIINILYTILCWIRIAGMIGIVIVALFLFIPDVAHNRFSPARILSFAASAILAGVVFWLLPDMIHFARTGSRQFVPATNGF